MSHGCRIRRAGHGAAYQLARMGYTVTILEKSPKPADLNRGGIPDWGASAEHS